VFGNGADTNSYDDFENTDLIIVWGSNTQEAHPIIYNHMRRGIKNGAKMVLVDPRKLPMANFAAHHLPVRVGTDIALANAIGHVIIEEQLYDVKFVERATEFFEHYKEVVGKYTPEYAEQITGVAAEQIRDVARMYATANRALIAWTLGITEHHNGADNVFALINLSLLTGHIGKPGSGLMPLRGQNNVQGGGDMGALPNKLPGFFNVEDDSVRAKFDEAWDCKIPAKNGLNQSVMFSAMRDGRIKFMYVIGENPIQSEANSSHTRSAFEQLDMLVVQDLFMTKTAEIADVVLPASGWGEVDGTFTNSERGIQRVRQVVQPPGEAKSDIWILQAIANHIGGNWQYESAEDVWNELRALSPSHYGMTYERLEREYELQWPCVSVTEPPEKILHTRLHHEEVGLKAKFFPVEYEVPVEATDEAYPFVLITGRRLAFYNTGVMTRYEGGKVKDLEEFMEINPLDAQVLGLENGQRVRVSSRRGSVEVPVKLTDRVMKGDVFMTFHFPDQVNTNILTNDVSDSKSGVSPYKYTAVRVETIQ
jgi:formate dehydrogenase major subunit